MSLLNEALRKNTSKGPLEMSDSFIGRKAFNIKKILIISVVIIVVSVALLWALSTRRTTAPAKPVAASATPAATEHPDPVVAENSPLKRTAAVDDSISRGKTDNKTAASESGGKTEGAMEKKRPSPIVKAKVAESKTSSETESVQEDTATSADKFYQKALQFHRDGRIKEAVGMYREVLKYAPSNSDAAYNLSSAYIELSDFSSAYELLSSLHSSNPGSAEIQLNLAVAEVGLGRPSDAIDLLKSLDSEDKNLKFSKLLHLGVAESQTGKLDEALACYKKAEEINGGVPKLLYNIAVVNDKLGKYRDAAVYYQKFLAHESPASSDAEAVKARIKTLQNYISAAGKE